MQRVVIALAFSIFFLQGAIAVEYEVFTESGLQGIKNDLGEVVVPAQYEKLGWSKGDFRIISESIGYQKNGKWGLLSIRNKKLTAPIYYHLSKFKEDLVLAAIKGQFSNQLFYGVLDANGKALISCSYFEIREEANSYIVSSYERGKVQTGLIDENFSLVIPTDYKEVHKEQNIIAVRKENDSWLFFSNKGLRLSPHEFFSYQVEGDFIKVNKGGSEGVIEKNTGELVFNETYKSINIEGDQYRFEPFSTWKLLHTELEEKRVFLADSVKRKEGFWVLHRNHNEVIPIDDDSLFSAENQRLVKRASEVLILKNLLNNKWSAWKIGVGYIVQEQDSVAFDGDYIFGYKQGGWRVYNKFGRQISKRKYQGVGYSNNQLIPVKLDGQWGVLDFSGELTVPAAYDSLIYSGDNTFIARYVGSWGVLNAFDHWLVPPSYNELLVCLNYFQGRKANQSFLVSKKNEVIYQTYGSMLPQDGFIEITNQEGKKGLVNENGKIVFYPAFTQVKKVKDYFVGLGDELQLKKESDNQIIQIDEVVQDVVDYSENFFLIKKGNRYGFIDENGKLRIAYIYDEAKPFHDGLAAIKLRGRWGFINKSEKIIIQPQFDYVSNFDSGIVIVQKKGKYGIMEKSGRMLLSAAYANIEKSENGNYYVKDESGLLGITGSDGSFILRNDFSNIQDLDNGLIAVERNEKWGIYESNGHLRIPFEYSRVVKGDNYLLLQEFQLTDK